MRTIRQTLSIHVTAFAATVGLLSGCTTGNQEAPALSGPSELGLAVSVTAAPQILPRDGSSTSTIAVRAFDAAGKPQKGQRLLLTASAGTLTLNEVLTGDDGKAPLVIYIAPGLNVPVSSATIAVTPVETGDARNTNTRTVKIDLSGPDVPQADFTFTGTTSSNPIAVSDVITFDARATTMKGSPCNNMCTYAWDFGDGSAGKDLIALHQYTSPGVFYATLSVTSSDGTSNSVTKPVVIGLPALTEPEFTFAPCLSLALKCITFTDVSFPVNGVTIVSRLWDFGDASSAVGTSDPTVDHTFPANANPVTYNVKLRLTDNFGRVTTTTTQVQVP
jgi:hypothetical protein